MHPPAIPHNEEARLRKLVDLQVLDTPCEEAFDALALLASKTAGTPIALLSFVDSKRQWFKASFGLKGFDSAPRDLAFCAHAILSNGVLEVNDALLDERFHDNPLVVGHPHIRYYAGAPVTLSDGLVMGTVCVIDQQPRRLTEAQLQELRMLALVAAKLLEFRRSESALSAALEDARRIERETEAQRRRLAVTLEGTQAATWEIDLHFGYARYSNRWLEIYEQRSHDRRGDVSDAWVRCVHPEDQADTRLAMATLLCAQSQVYAVEMRRRDNTGSWRWVEERAWVGQWNANHEPMTIYGATMDVSERKLATLALKAERALFNSGPCAVLTWAGNSSWSVRTATPNTADLLGFSANELVAGKPTFLSLVHPEHKPLLLAAAQDLRPGTPLQRRLRFLHASGQYRHVTLVLRAMKVSARESGVILGYLLDTTDSADAEERALLGEQKLQAIVDSTLDAIINVNHEQLIVSFNPAASRLFGYSRAEVLGMLLSTLVPDTGRHRQQNAVSSLMDGSGNARATGDFRRTTGRRKDGSEFPIEISVSRSGAQGDEVYTAVLRDQTDRQRVQDAVQAAQMAEKSSKAKSEFLSRVSHELRTPLNAVLGFSELMLMDPTTSLAEGHRKYTLQIRQSGKHLLTLIDDLLDLARIERADLTRKLVAVDLCKAVSEVLEMVAPCTIELGLKLTFEPVHDHAWVLGDERAIRQVMLNVISNAIKYNRPGGTVHISCVQSGADWELVVQDSGQGISAEQLGHLFEKYNRLGAEHSGCKGTGLGLVICRELLDMMEGRLSLKSVEGTGSSVHIRLRSCPRTSIDSVQRAQPSQAPALQ